MRRVFEQQLGVFWRSDNPDGFGFTISVTNRGRELLDNALPVAIDTLRTDPAARDH